MSFIVLIFCSWAILEIAWGLSKQNKMEEEYGARSWFCFDCEEDWDEGYVGKGDEPNTCTQCLSSNIKEIK